MIMEVYEWPLSIALVRREYGKRFFNFEQSITFLKFFDLLNGHYCLAVQFNLRKHEPKH